MLGRTSFCAVAACISLIACGGLDPSAFAKKRPAADAPETAGWVFDAGPRAGGGSGGSASPPRGGAGGGRDAGDERDAGDSGQAGEGGAGGDADGRSGASSAGGVGGRGSGGSVAGSATAGGMAMGGAAGRGGGTGGSRAGGAAGATLGGRGGAGGSASGGLAGSSGAAARALYFSEYVEGSSSYKALEIAARADSVLTGCRLVTYFNGATQGSGIALDGAVSPSAPYVLCSTQLATLLGAACQRATNLTFNGDDAIALECDGAALDVIGELGVDPGDAWGSGEASTLNHTLRRRCPPAADPNGTDAFEPSAGWLGLAVDTFDGLGRIDCDGG